MGFYANRIVIVLMWCATGVQCNSPLDSALVISQCRAQCATQYTVSTDRDHQCVQNTDCVQCWKMCHGLVKQPERYQWLCEHSSCSGGCKTSCGYMDGLDNIQQTTDAFTMPRRTPSPRPGLAVIVFLHTTH